jgi:biopolymer transport protein ExbD
MAINVGPGPDGDEDAVIASINTTPLVDVMLVLLIIFLITIPVVTASIPVKLPKERIEARDSKREGKAENIIISVDAQSQIFWYETPVASVDALTEKLRKVADMKPQPEVQVRGDMAARYEGVGRVLLACQRAGIVKVAFITEPPPLN